VGTTITNNARCPREIKFRITTPKATFNKKILFISRLDLNLKKTLVNCYIWGIALYGADTKTLRKVDQKYLGNCEMWCWRRMEIRWTDHVRNEVLQTVKEERNVLQRIKGRNACWIGHILRRNCLLKLIMR
jgi:hypothetical protein